MTINKNKEEIFTNYYFINKDIIDIKADIIVNASNGIGYMGGFLSRIIKIKGIAESINYATKGAIEKESKKVLMKNKYIPIILNNKKPGDIFITSANNLNAKYIIHAVTMKFPGMTTNIKIIEILLPKIIEKARELKAKSLVIPLLGTGTGKINKNKILDLYNKFFINIKDIKIIICYI